MASASTTVILPVTSSGTVLVQNGSPGPQGPAGPPGSSGGSGAGLPSTIVAKSGTYTAAANDFVEATTTSAGFTVTLPTAPAAGALVAVKKVSSDTNTLTIAAAGGGTIDGSSTVTTVTQWAGLVLEHKGSNVWRVAASMTTTGPVGPTGPTGPAGPTGPTGPTGPSALDTGWAIKSGLAAGQFSVMTVQGCAVSSSGIPTEGQMQLTPIYVTRACNLYNLWAGNIFTAGSTGAVIRLGLYGTDSEGRPFGAPIIDAGTIDPTTTGQRSPLLASGSPALAIGKYALAMVVQGAATTRPNIAWIQGNALGAPHGGIASSINVGWVSTASVSGALPTLASTDVSLAPDNQSMMYGGIGVRA